MLIQKIGNEYHAIYRKGNVHAVAKTIAQAIEYAMVAIASL